MAVADATRMGAILALLLAMPAMAGGQEVSSAAVHLFPSAASFGASISLDRDAGRIVEQATPLMEDDLAGNRGGGTTVTGNQTLTAVTTGNVLNGNYVAGSVVLSDQALSNFNGLGNFAINTGAQVSIQSGLNLTINVAP